jgi:nicotinamidase-related amidase
MANDIALIIIDIQVGVFQSAIIPPVARAKQLLSQIIKLIAKARAASIPIIYVQHSGASGHPLEQGTSGWHIHPDITPRDQDILIQKRTPDSFYNTQLQSELESRDIKRLVIAGIQTEFCVDTTCRRAFSLGYQVTLAKDAHSTWDTELLSASQIIAHHNNVLGEWFAKTEEVSEIDFGILSGNGS